MSSISIFIALLATIVHLLDVIAADPNISPSLKIKADQMEQIAIQMTVEAVNAQDSQNIGAPSPSKALSEGTPCEPDLILKGMRQTADRVMFSVAYSTGCTLDQATAYSWKVSTKQSGTVLEEYSSTIGQKPYPDSKLWKYEYAQNYRVSPVTISFKIGDITQTIDVY